MTEQFADEKRNDPRSTEELIRLALTETNEDAAWEPVGVLRYRATREVLDAAERLCVSPIAKERELAANILSQLGVPERSFPAECFDCLAKMLHTESDPDVLQAISIAFGFLDDPRCIDLLIPLKSHTDGDVRFGVVRGLSGHDHPAAIETLIELSRDEDEDVRDWATFGLGTLIESDTHEIREALLARTLDTHDDCRGEALVGLARRKDERVIEPLLKEITSDGVGSLAIEAAEEIGSPRLLPALLELKEELVNAPGTNTDDVDRAIASCSENQGQISGSQAITDN
jgi:HEAT repeat protein